MSKRTIHKLWWATLSLLIVLNVIILATPLRTIQAQGGQDDFTVAVDFDSTIVSIADGKITFSNGSVVFVTNPSLLTPDIMVGAEVDVVAQIVADTLVLQSIAVRPMQTPAATMEATMSATVEPQPTMEATLSADCPEIHDDSEVASRLSEAFNVSEMEIWNWKCAGYGFGEITKAYLLARDSGKSVSDILAMRKAGMGWGDIIKSLGLKAGDYSGGKIIKTKHDGSDDDKDRSGKGSDDRMSDDKGGKGSDDRGSDDKGGSSNSGSDDKGGDDKGGSNSGSDNKGSDDKGGSGSNSGSDDKGGDDKGGSD